MPRYTSSRAATAIILHHQAPRGISKCLPPAPLPPPSEINGVTIITKTTTSRMIYARPVNCAAPLPRTGTRAAVSLRDARARVGSPQHGPAAPVAA
ncbi:hypothetical protein MRX96_007524 [Rhipicephalus microplus]